MNERTASAAHEAWAKSKGSLPCSVYVAGYEQGARDERARIAAFLSENAATVTGFAPGRPVDLVAYILREMTPDHPIGEHVEGDDLPSGHAPVESLSPFLARRIVADQPIGTVSTPVDVLTPVLGSRNEGEKR